MLLTMLSAGTLESGPDIRIAASIAAVTAVSKDLTQGKTPLRPESAKYGQLRRPTVEGAADVNSAIRPVVRQAES
jgi:hypothetical protein